MSATDDDFTNLRKALRKLQHVQRNLAYASRTVDRGHLVVRLIALKEAIIAEAVTLGRLDDL